MQLTNKIVSTVFVCPSCLPIATETLYIRQLSQPRTELNSFLLEMGSLLQTKLPCNFSQKHLLSVSFSNLVERNFSQILPKRKIEKRKSSLLTIHSNCSIIPPEISYPQSLHIKDHLVLHFLIASSLVSNAISWIAWKNLVSSKPSKDYLCFSSCTSKMESSCNVEVHVSCFRVDWKHKRFFNFFNIIKSFVEKN